MSRLLEVESLSVGYAGASVLAGVSLHVDKGETVAVVGGNGAGKTTLIRGICGMVAASGGGVRFDGRDISGWPTDAVCEVGLAQVPEGRQLFPTLPVEDNLKLGAILKRARPRAAANLERVFDLFPTLKERRRQLAGTLSGGEQQMVAIGRALMAEPAMIMLDEPSLGLSPMMVEAMFDTVVALGKSGMSILLVEQNAKLALEVAQRGYVMESGTITLSGAAGELLGSDAVQRAYLGG